ncbi:MAG: transcriptional repressor [Solirubrobacteraceae bacterium]
MTSAPQVRALAFEDLESAVGALRARGLRVSIARRLVLELLFAASGPVSAEHVANSLAIDAASVYRNLEMLERHGLVHHVHLGHGPGLYVLVGRGESEYLYCDRCATVEAVAPEQLDPVREELRRSFGYEVRFTHFPIVGLCPACAAKGPAEGEEGSAAEPASSGSGSGEGGRADARTRRDAHEHDHSHGDIVHSHPHSHPTGPSEAHGHEH